MDSCLRSFNTTIYSSGGESYFSNEDPCRTELLKLIVVEDRNVPTYTGSFPRHYDRHMAGRGRTSEVKRCLDHSATQEGPDGVLSRHFTRGTRWQGCPQGSRQLPDTRRQGYPQGCRQSPEKLLRTGGYPTRGAVRLQTVTVDDHMIFMVRLHQLTRKRVPLFILHICFVDLTEAYDSVDRTLW